MASGDRVRSLASLVAASRAGSLSPLLAQEQEVQSRGMYTERFTFERISHGTADEEWESWAGVHGRQGRAGWGERQRMGRVDDAR